MGKGPRRPRRAYDIVARRDGALCRYCGRTDRPLTFDHVVPRSKGGTNRADNLVLACSPCNAAKGDRKLSDFLNDEERHDSSR